MSELCAEFKQDGPAADDTDRSVLELLGRSLRPHLPPGAELTIETADSESGEPAASSGEIATGDC